MGRHRTGPLNCTICGKHAIGRGLCRLHRRRLAEYGTTELPPGVTRGHAPAGNAAWQALSDKSTLPEWYGRAYGCEPKRKGPRRKCNVCRGHISHKECWSADGNGYVHRWCQPHREGTYPVHFADTFQPMQLHRGAAPGHGVVV